MSKRTIFTTISPLPANVNREVVIDFLHSHVEMIDLNPLVVERHPISPPPGASSHEKDCSWYSLTDHINYIPGGRFHGDVKYTCAFHDLPNGIQTHCRAPMGLDLRDKWTLCGTLPGEPPEPVELGIGAPGSGLYIREDVDLRCNLFMTGFVKKNLQRSHAALVHALVERAQIASAARRRMDHRARASVVEPIPRPPSAASHTSAHAFNRRPLHDTTKSPLAAAAPAPAPAPAPQPASPVKGQQLSHHRQSEAPPPPQKATRAPCRRPVQARPSPPPTAAHHSSLPPALGSAAQRQAQFAPPASAQAQIHAHLYSDCPASLRAPVAAPPRGYKALSLQARPPTHSSAAPAPLRVRGSSVGSNQAPYPRVPAPAPARPAPYPMDDDDDAVASPSPPSRSTTTVSSESESRVIIQYEHPEYPHMSPYVVSDSSGGGSSSPSPSSPSDDDDDDDEEEEEEDDIHMPATPGFFVAVRAPTKEAEVPRVAELECPAVLRPAREMGCGATLSGPFSAEFEWEGGWGSDIGC